ncbi:MAG TPA: hypothetical protein DCZ92_01680 [Elusimicrobia bacterium]|nr:MAG: hypothetical protein A2016_12235 [Elusimicrobia bacterium GWF2_62_30]HBA59537.1 hypothetical protein [Elusimicrobiota bacterium]
MKTRDWIKRYFTDEQAPEALIILFPYGSKEGHREVERVKRDAIIISRGSLKKLKEAVDAAIWDYRDILAGEEADPWLIGELRRWGVKE